MNQSGVSERVPLPEFKNVDGASVTFDVSGLVLAGIVNRRRPLSGAVLMLVAR